jgi:signal transduction histidine kinase
VDLAIFSDVFKQEPAATPTQILVAALPALVLLSWRRRHAAAACLAACAYTVLVDQLVGWTPPLTLAVLVYSAAAAGPPRRAGVCLVSVLAVLGVALPRDFAEERPYDGSFEWYLVLTGVLTFILALEGGAFIAGRRAAGTRARTERLERAIADERVRISRELHDIVAHSVTVITMHAAGGRRALHRDRRAAEDALGLIEDLGKQTMNELRRMLGLLRAEDSSARGGRPPTLASVGDLLDAARRSGLDVHLREHGPRKALDPSVELAAYRSIQEGLTNAMRYAGAGASTAIRLTWSADRLTVEVHDDGAGSVDPALAALSTGHGLVGLRERIAIAGGTLASGPGLGGGWHLQVVLPVSRSEAEIATPSTLVPPATPEGAT